MGTDYLSVKSWSRGACIGHSTEDATGHAHIPYESAWESQSHFQSRFLPVHSLGDSREYPKYPSPFHPHETWTDCSLAQYQEKDIPGSKEAGASSLSSLSTLLNLQIKTSYDQLPWFGFEGQTAVLCCQLPTVTEQQSKGDAGALGKPTQLDTRIQPLPSGRWRHVLLPTLSTFSCTEFQFNTYKNTF